MPAEPGERFPTLTYGNVDPKDGMPARGGYSASASSGWAGSVTWP
ncbi:hypothetical protein AB0C29_21230 [Actinoplanes sp. NPDC048791]